MIRAVRIAALCACATLVAAAAHAQKKPSSCGADVLLSVSVEGTPSDTQGYNLYSDGGGAYVNGAGRLDARLQIDNCTRDSILNMNLSQRKLITSTTSGNATVGFVNFDQIANVPVTPAVDERSAEEFCLSVPNDYAGCGIDAGRYFVRRSVTMQFDVGGDNRLIFNKAPAAYESWNRNLCPAGGDQSPCQTSFIKVFHIVEGTSETWVLEPEQANSLPGMTGTEALAAQIEVSRKGVPTYVGAHILPFRMTLTRLP